MTNTTAPDARLPVGVVLRRTRGVTRWAPYSWRATALLPGAGPARWKTLRAEGDAIEMHADTVFMDLFRADTQAYVEMLAMPTPAIWVVLRREEEEVEEDAASPDGAEGLKIHLVTPSPYEAQDYLDSGEEIVEAVPAPEGLLGFIDDFVRRHHEDEVFVKRRRDRVRTDKVEAGKGDARVRQMADVYRAPAALKPRAADRDPEDGA